MNGYEIKEMEHKDFMAYFNKHKEQVFKGDHSYRLWDLLDEEEMAKVEALRTNKEPFQLFLGLFDEQGNFAGWSWGFQENATTFYMVNSAVLKEHRRKGLYSQLLKKTLELTTEKGFQLVYSRHCATNNAVIIPKLKAGFVISKMELDDIFGVLIHLHYYSNEKRRKIMDYRCGQLKPDQELKDIFKF